MARALQARRLLALVFTVALTLSACGGFDRDINMVKQSNAPTGIANEELVRQMEQDLRRSDEWLRRFMQSAMPADKFWEPLVDVYETRDAVKIKIELAGVKPDDIHLEISGDGSALTVRGCRRDEPAMGLR